MQLENVIQFLANVDAVFTIPLDGNVKSAPRDTGGTLWPR